jgi:hypothetical protein
MSCAFFATNFANVNDPFWLFEQLCPLIHDNYLLLIEK